MALRMTLALNLLSRVKALIASVTNGLKLEDDSSFILLEDNVSVLELE